MYIDNLYFYPVKSLRGIAIDTARLTPHGIPHDRSFMLLREHEPGSRYAHTNNSRYENMAVSSYAAMCLFQPAIVEHDSEAEPTGAPPSASSNEDPSSDSITISNSAQNRIRITYTDPVNGTLSVLHIPLVPDSHSLDPIPVNLHNSPTTALRMHDSDSRWFSARFGFPVVLAYSPDHRRPVLGNIAPNANVRNRAYHDRLRKIAAKENGKQGWFGSISNALPSAPSLFGSREQTEHASGEAEQLARPYELAFADCSPYLIVSCASFKDVAARLPPPHSSSLEVEKFRPNIIVSADDNEELAAWDEDYWAELAVSPQHVGQGASMAEHSAQSNTTLQLTANCIRCTSLNVDFATGKFGSGPKGQVLKSLQVDRRVDAGKKYGPVFGRYGFLPNNDNSTAREISVGDRVEVTRRNDQRTVWRWPGSGITKKDDLYPDVDVFT